jgi:hypothetical protein
MIDITTLARLLLSALTQRCTSGLPRAYMGGSDPSTSFYDVGADRLSSCEVTADVIWSSQKKWSMCGTHGLRMLCGPHGGCKLPEPDGEDSRNR